MKKDGFIIQPNHISTARFNLSALEKNIIYIIVDKLQLRMTMKTTNEFTEQEVKILIKTIEKNNNYSRVKNAVKSLGSKHVEFEINIPGTNKIKKTLTVLTSGYDYIPYSGEIAFKIPSSACIFFCYIGGGFTAFQKCIAISLNSIFSKHMYELCCRWKDRGGYTCTLQDLRSYLLIENKYLQLAHLRNKVLDTALKELKQKGDYYFTYQLIKKNSRKFTDINFKIHKNTLNQEHTFLGVDESKYNYAYRFLCVFYPNYLDDKALRYIEEISNNGSLNFAFQRFKNLDKEYTSGVKTKKDIRNLLDYVILPEYNIKKRPVKTKSHLS
ncbi:replication initiation protein [Maribacter aquivivus]|uniref:replication initiation protein n=1 Tax=Maribacter aquivivus TaxID=228958 RepID=UPI0024956E6E|nr:replication initiation protein [Maribacter aquivivus]